MLLSSPSSPSSATSIPRDPSRNGTSPPTTAAGPASSATPCSTSPPIYYSTPRLSPVPFHHPLPTSPSLRPLTSTTTASTAPSHVGSAAFQSSSSSFCTPIRSVGRSHRSSATSSCTVWVSGRTTFLERSHLPSTTSPLLLNCTWDRTVSRVCCRDDFALRLPKLQYLYLYENSFEGPIPKSLSMATELLDLQLCNNSFTGSISLDFSAMSLLKKLDIGGNKLLAREPTDWLFLDSLSSCRNLTYLALWGNDLGGEFPDYYISNLSLSLEFLSFYNKIESRIPMDIGKFVNLTTLNLGGNLFAGPIPNSIGRLLKMQELFLDKNMLTGSIPPSLGNLRELNILSLQGNALTGSLPTSLGDCTKLRSLDISGNSLNGTIARQILSLSSLSMVLNLSRNSFAGSLPAEVGKLVNLQSLDVSDNQLSGEIPTSLGDCVVLQNLYMQGNSFQGVIPSSFSNLKGVLVINLSRNNLSGPIPEFLARMSSLRWLNLSSNNLEGKIPEIGIFANTSGTVISVLGNDRLCGRISESILRECTTENPKRQRISTASVVIIVVSSVIALATLAIILLCCAKKRSSGAAKRQSSMPNFNHLDRVTYQDLYTATNGFAEESLIGKGGFGSVYRGILYIDENKRDVAIKVLNLEAHGALKSFSTECEVLRNTRHSNLVKILTACSGYDVKGNEFKALIFEFMANGNLDKWLHAEGDGPHVHLTLAQRLNIAVDVASGLEYLHHGGQVPIVHCDLKPSNVLLDVRMGAHVGDFGLAKLLHADNEALSSSIWLKGSIGCIPPEYGMGIEVSTQGDVYNYGVFLLELFTGKRPTDDEFESGTSLRGYVESAYPEGVMSVMDPSLASQSEGDQSDASRKAMHESVSSVIRIALSVWI